MKTVFRPLSVIISVCEAAYLSCFSVIVAFCPVAFYPTSQRSEEHWMLSAASVCVCLFVCQHDNFRTSKHRMMKLEGQVHCTTISAEFECGSQPTGCAPPKLWRWATTSGKSAQAVQFKPAFIRADRLDQSVARRGTGVVIIAQTCTRIEQNLLSLFSCCPETEKTS